MSESSKELYRISDMAAASVTEFEDSISSEKIVEITEICSDLNCCWSGSNLGYHANVYYSGLLSPPPGAHFSPEWGFVGNCILDKAALKCH